jgi:hypothetical protein
MSEAPEEGTEPTESDGEQAADEQTEDEARRVNPDEGGHQYTGDDSAAKVNDQSADE